MYEERPHAGPAPDRCDAGSGLGAHTSPRGASWRSGGHADIAATERHHHLCGRPRLCRHRSLQRAQRRAAAADAEPRSHGGGRHPADGFLRRASGVLGVARRAADRKLLEPGRHHRRAQPERETGDQRRRADDRGGAQAAGLRDSDLRQVAPGAPQAVPADAPRVRRVPRPARTPTTCGRITRPRRTSRNCR